MNKFLKAMHDPSSVFKYPMQVVENKYLTHNEKLQILQQWAYDAREMGVADEENMLPNKEFKSPGDLLHEINEALHILTRKAA